jgi:hypothetical protein
MPYSFRVFGDGILPTTKATLMTIAANHSAAVDVKLVNLTSTEQANINVYVNANGTSRRIFPKDLKIGVGDDGGMVEVCAQEMEEGDTIEGGASSASSVQYVISGIDRE